MQYEFCVIGGGIVGLATALALLERRPSASLILFDKEPEVGTHQTGHNSGVIHSGIYYEPSSLKAKLCKEGCLATKAFCVKHDIPFEVRGKLIVATTPAEKQAMDRLYQRSLANDIEVEYLSSEALHHLEPNVSGLGALRVPSTGIVDYQKICRTMAGELRDKGAEIRLGERVTRISETDNAVEVGTNGGTWLASKLIACAGLQSDRVAALSGLKTDVRIIPFKGEYFKLPPHRNEIVHHLIYPVPDSKLPFLGIHLTPMIDGSVTVGPNAILALDREGYRKIAANGRDAFSALSYPGLWRAITTNWKSSLQELGNSLSRRGYLQQCRKYCPSLELADLQPFPPGIRAQAVGRNGQLIHDFLFRKTERMLHVLNAPSPAATSAIPIGGMIADEIAGDRRSN